MSAKRRRSKRPLFMALAMFVAVGLFVFLMEKNQVQRETVEAASLANFDPGYIISDYQMSNYNAMTEAEIQAFLTKKNPCNNKDKGLYDSLVAKYPNHRWRFENGHFVCLSEEKFGDGEALGKGETAARIIWQAAQDYKINPQVLIVLLEKEQGLITDTYPHNIQYRAATGYGCPDTAPCSSQYYGFKNQVRKAASLFRTVLDGGWTNYPLGNNYVQYNPNASCGGSVVNIKNLATSALYRYTPYQPNKAALAAGYGTASCGAYGNRNFYLYFEDWFGGVTQTTALRSQFDKMIEPRLIYVKKGARYIDPSNNVIGTRIFASFEYFTHLNYRNNDLCLSIGDKRNCYLYSDLEEISVTQYGDMAKARMLITEAPSYIDYENKSFSARGNNQRIVFDKKVYVNGQLCLIPQGAESGKCIQYKDLSELPVATFKNMVVPRRLFIKEGAKYIDVQNGISKVVEKAEKLQFNKLTYWFGELCLQPQKQNSTTGCILYKELVELQPNSIKRMVVPRYLTIGENVKVYDIESIQISNNYVGNEKKIYFDNLVYLDGKLCLTESDAKILAKGTCILYSDLSEIPQLTVMDIPRTIVIQKGAKYYDLENGGIGTEVVNATKLHFTEKITTEDGLCLRSAIDKSNNIQRCILYSALQE